MIGLTIERQPHPQRRHAPWEYALTTADGWTLSGRGADPIQCMERATEQLREHLDNPYIAQKADA